MRGFLPFACLVGTFGFTLGAAPLRVVTLHSVLTEIVTEVGGAEVTVTCLLRPGDDPHTFNPPPAEVRTLAQADLIVASGFGLEPFLDKLVANSGTQAPLVSVSAAIKDVVPSSGSHHGERNRGEIDPHWWHSLANVRAATLYVRDRLAELRPAATAGFQARAAAYLARLDALDAWAQAEVAQLPPARRQLVTSHDAFGYLARDYGFIVHPLQGVSPEAEPSARDLGALIDLIKREHIRAVFVDNTENPKLLAAMLRESGAQLGGTLYADGLGPVGSPAATYAGMFRHNLRTIVEALK
ncbi:MAG TPA: zinc ABC transporter substrate-binding protein [Opitutaceae bacterium]|nr:zinc ABC transporter substrate-binding protein [Opitutaceae bacterium]